MYDPNFLNQLAHEIAKRLKAELHPAENWNGGNGGSNDNGRQPLPVLRRLLDVHEAAAYLRRSESALYHLVGRREIACVRHGRNLRFDVKELDRWIDSDKT